MKKITLLRNTLMLLLLAFSTLSYGQTNAPDNSILFKTAIINVDNLNFRSTPEISDNIIGTLKFEEKVIFEDSISIESNNIKKGTLNKKIIVNYKGRKYNFNKHKVVEIDDPDGDYTLVVSIKVIIEVGNGEYILVSVPTSDIDFSNKKIWARIKQGNKTGYVYYKFLNFKTTSDDIAIETAPPAPKIIEIVEDEIEVEETVIESTETDETEEIIVEEIEEVEETEEVIEDVSFMIIEDVPVFPGCKGNKAALKKCFSKMVQKHFSGKFDADLPNKLGLDAGRKRVIIGFKIDRNGNVVNIQVRAPHPKIKKEVVKVMKMLPKMKPGRQRGKAVGVKYSIPFTLIVE